MKRSLFFILAVMPTLWFSCNSHKQDTTPVVKSYPVFRLKPRHAETFSDYPATIQGLQNVEIRPKIDGYVQAIYVDEGASVSKGQKLFKISAPQYEQNLRTEQANVKIAQAEVDAARMQVNKIQPLVERDIISSYQLEAARYTLESKLAALAQANAAVRNAEINLSYTTIYSPVSGVIGILPYKIGSLISSTTASPLTTVSDISSIYAYFSINERQGLDFFVSAKGVTMQEKLKSMPAVSLVLANGSQLAKTGTVQTASGLINTQTGSINMRATFQNPGGLVRSGSSAVVRIPTQLNSALLVPQRSTYQIQGKLFVYVLDDSSKVSSREIVTSASCGQSFVVQQGLRPGDRIVADGIGTLREGVAIKPRFLSDSAVYHNF